LKGKKGKLMDFDEIKQFINSNKERVIIVENGKPVVVLISFDEYKKRFKDSKEENEIETIPKEEKENTKKELTIEDLPF